MCPIVFRVLYRTPPPGRLATYFHVHLVSDSTGETLNALAEVEPLRALAEQLTALSQSGPDALAAYRRNVRLKLFKQASRVILEHKE